MYHHLCGNKHIPVCSNLSTIEFFFSFVSISVEGIFFVPNILKIQEMIEEAWSIGMCVYLHLVYIHCD